MIRELVDVGDPASHSKCLCPAGQAVRAVPLRRTLPTNSGSQCWHPRPRLAPADRVRPWSSTTEVFGDGSSRSSDAETDRLLGRPDGARLAGSAGFRRSQLGLARPRHGRRLSDRGFILRAFGGYSTCRFCGKENGALEVSDGTWYWPDGLAHYLSEHDVRLPREFVEHVYAELDSLSEADRETEWWRSRGGIES